MAVTLHMDKERHARLTTKGMKAFEDKTGKSLLKGIDIADLTPDELTVLIWAYLMWEDPKLTIETCETFDVAAFITVLAPSIKQAPVNPTNPPHGGNSKP